jgi:DHA2 family methylenomycin A resistance protein-like MFS transporter
MAAAAYAAAMSATPTAAPPAPRVGRPGGVLATVTGAQVLATASTTVVAVALPDLGRDLGAGGTAQQWVVDAFVLVFASLLVAGGVLGDRRGRRDAFLGGLAIFACGSLWCALAPGVGWLLAGRVLQALGPPLILPASLAIIAMAYPDPGRRAKAVGVWAIGSGTGLALGPLLGGALVDAFGWRAVFAVNVPVVALLLPLGLRSVPRDRPAAAPHRFDAGAAGLLTLAVAALVFGLIEGRSLGWGSAPIVLALAASIALTVVFVRRERRHPAPLVDLSLLGQRAFLAANLGGAALFGALTAAAVYVSVFLQQVQGRSALEAGLCLVPEGLLICVVGPVAGRVTARIGPRVPIVTGTLAVCASILALLTLHRDSPALHVALAFGLLGAGSGFAMPSMTVTALSAAPAARVGMASAIHNASRQLGQTFSIAVLGTILFAVAGEEADGADLAGPAAAAWLDGLHAAMLVCGIAIAASAVVMALLIPAGRLRSPGR